MTESTHTPTEAAPDTTVREDTKYVYLFHEIAAVEERVGEWENVRSLLGGKGAGLADMTRIGVPVPPGFTVTTDACKAYLAEGGMPEAVWAQEVEAIRLLEEVTGKEFGGLENSLLLSCRSGAKLSMPGMMDTILNIGLNDEVARKRVEKGQDARFVYDCYRRLIQMFGSVVLGVDDDFFEHLIEAQRRQAGVTEDAKLTAEDWKVLVDKFKELVRVHSGQEFPEDPYEQLKRSTQAVFNSWNSKRAGDYRRASGIPDDLGTAVNIQSMVFGNTGEDSGTGVVMSRHPSTGAPQIDGDFLVNAQGEDVVAGIRQTEPISQMQVKMPEGYRQLVEISHRLEKHYRNMQDMEFTIEHGKLWLLQTRDGKRTAQSEVRIAVDMVKEGMISKAEAVRRVSPDQIDFFLHPQFESRARQSAQLIARGLNVSPGAGVGVIAFHADMAEKWAEQGRDVILVRPETKPDDVHGMLAAKGILTSRGGRTSHAALVARQFGKPAVVGVSNMDLSLEDRTLTVGEIVLKEGDWISIDGATGDVFLGQLPTQVPDFSDSNLLQVLEWADDIRSLGVWANADNPADAARARGVGAEGIGLCRTEHMFFEAERLPIMQQMIMASNKSERNEALEKLLPLQTQDFEGLFRSMDGLPLTIRLLDPPLHEFLPSFDELTDELANLKLKLQHQGEFRQIDNILAEIRVKTDHLERVSALREANPMLGTRGVRLAILFPELTKMQVKAIFDAACTCAADGVDARPHVMIPLTCHANELKSQQTDLTQVALKVMKNRGVEVPYQFGTMIEIPRAAVTAGELAEFAEFFSFGTNDLTQTVFGISRDDAEAGFLIEYISQGILDENPFETIDQEGVGTLMRWAVQQGKRTRPDIEIGICGEHGGDPRTIAFCHHLGMDYVSCSPFRVPVARLAAAHAALDAKAAQA